MKPNSGFSLVEVALALGIVAFALVGIVGLVPVGMEASRAAVDDTRSASIAQDAFTRVGALLNNSSSFENPPAPAWSGSGPFTTTFWYDNEGQFLDQSDGTNYSQAQYRVRATAGDLSSYPPYATKHALKALKIEIGWPVNASNGEIAGAAANASRRVFQTFLRQP